MLLLFVLFMFSVGSGFSDGSNDSVTVCDTVGCRSISTFLASKVDFDALPCDDFFAFTCGQVLKNKKVYIPALASQIKDVKDRVVELMESPTLYGKETPIRSAKRFYERCLDMDPTEVDLKIEISNFVKDYASWPLFNPGSSSTFNIWEIAAKLQGELSISPFFDFDIKSSPKCDAAVFEPTISPNKWLFQRSGPGCSLVLKKEFQDVMFGQTVPSHQTLEEICMFEKEMADYFGTKKDDTNQELYLEELDTVQHSKPIWKSYFTQIAQHDPSNKLADWLKDKTIRVEKVSFLEFLVEKVETTSQATVGNFLLFKLIRFANEFLMRPTDVGKLDEEVMPIMFACNDYSSQGFQKCKCLSQTMNLFTKVAGYLFINPGNKTQLENDFARNITNLIRNSARTMFADNKWLSEMAKVRITKKLGHMVSTIGFDKSLLNMTELMDMYKHLTVKNSDNYFDIYKRFKRFSAADLGIKFDRNKLSMAEVTVNAAYDPNRNSIFLPFAILKTLGLRSEYPDWFNLASPGSVIGHEIFHAFDNRGSSYDHIGSQMSYDRKNPYLMVKSQAQYENLTKCFVDDYSQHNYTFEGNYCCSIDGGESLGENLADFNGIQATFKAFQSVKELRDPTVLGGDFKNYTEEQMFFISYGTTHCTNQRNFESEMSDSTSLVHSPNDARVNVVLRNLPEFREAFNCQPGDFMYQNNLGGQCKFY